MFLTQNPFSDHGPSKKVLSEAFKYHIPEDIPAHERTAFHGAAAAAANLLLELSIPAKKDERLTNNKNGNIIKGSLKNLGGILF